MKKPTLQRPPRVGLRCAVPTPGRGLAGAVPASPVPPRLATEVIAYHQPDHVLSQQYRELLEKILTEVPGDGNLALFFAALMPGAGTTTTVLNLAVCGAADLRRQAVVVDTNLERPCWPGALVWLLRRVCRRC